MAKQRGPGSAGARAQVAFHRVQEEEGVAAGAEVVMKPWPKGH